MGKKKKKQACLMKEWPNDDGRTVPFEDLIFPIKKVLIDGYRLERYNTKQFVYTGYNIGKLERIYFPTPEERFSARWLENEEKFKRTLLDNALITTFQLGIEQGRRLDRQNRYNNCLLRDIIDSRTKTIAKLRAELSKYDPSYANDEIPEENDNEELLIDSIETEELENVDVRDTKEDLS